MCAIAESAHSSTCHEYLSFRHLLNHNSSQQTIIIPTMQIESLCRTRYLLEHRNGRIRPSSWPRTLWLLYSQCATHRSTGSCNIRRNGSPDLRSDMRMRSRMKRRRHQQFHELTRFECLAVLFTLEFIA